MEEISTVRQGNPDTAGTPKSAETVADSVPSSAGRIEEYIRSVGDPYLFRSDGITVHIRFCGEASFQDALIRALSAGKDYRS